MGRSRHNTISQLLESQKTINTDAVRHHVTKNFSQRFTKLCFACCICVLVLPLTGCNIAWQSRKSGLHTLWGDFNTYNQPGWMYEQRHHLIPNNRIINEYRWLHGPVSLASSPHNTKRERTAHWQHTDAFAPSSFPELPIENSESTTIPGPENMPGLVPLNPSEGHAKLAPRSQNNAQRSNNPPVEIIIPSPLSPIESKSGFLDENTEDNNTKNQKQYLAPPSILGPTARYRRSVRPTPPLRATGYQRKAALPSSSILFARP